MAREGVVFLEGDVMNLIERLRSWRKDDAAGAADEAADRIEELEAALRSLIDDEPCWYDHHGYCQAHGLSSPCEMAEARKLLDSE